MVLMVFGVIGMTWKTFEVFSFKSFARHLNDTVLLKFYWLRYYYNVKRKRNLYNRYNLYNLYKNWPSHLSFAVLDI